ncbi:MAG: hypothetical protein IJ189_05980 [Clostridia bacterium]|nr:hypothetical protein [Clostridia bacterium]
MPTLTVTADAFYLSSSWTGTKQSSGAIKYSTPTIDRETKVFNLSAIPSGSTIQSAQLSVYTNGRGDSFAYRGNSALYITNDHTGSNAVNALEWFSGVTTFGNFPIGFRFQAYGGSGGAGSHTAKCRITQIQLIINYALPYTACSAPTSITLNKTEATPGETLRLSWSGAKAGSNVPITGYEVYRAGSESGSYALLSRTAELYMDVLSPDVPGSYFFKVKTLGNRTGYDSALSSTSASVNMHVTAPGLATGLTLSQSSQYPEGEATLSWTAAQDGQDNPVTGYAVWQSESDNGPFVLLKQANDTACVVIAPQQAVRYFKVQALGQAVNGSLSLETAALSANLSGTSDFSWDAAAVDAGTPVTVTVLTNTEKAHTLTVSIGPYSDVVTSAKGAASLSFTPPLSWLSALPNSATGEMTLRLQTEGAGTIIHHVLLRCPDDVAPAGLMANIAPVSNDVPASWQVYLAGHSAVEISITEPGQAPYGASIVRYTLEGPGIHVQTEALPLTVQSGLLTENDAVYTLSATDSRGRASSIDIPVPVLPYSMPSLNRILSRRCDEDGNEQDEGTWALCTVTPVFSSCDGHNTAACAVSYRKLGDDGWIFAGNIADGRLLFGSGGIDLPNNWEIRYVVTDALGYATTYYDVITRAVWEMHVKRGGGAWAFGGVADTDGALRVYGDVIADNIDDIQTRLGMAEIAAYDSGERTLYGPNGEELMFRRIGNTVMLTCGNFSCSEKAFYLATLPVGFRPVADVRVYCAGQYGNLNVQPNGKVYADAATAGSPGYYIRTTATYLTADPEPTNE